MTHGAWAAGRGVVAAILLLLALATANIARAEDIVIDGETITDHDIDQRSKFDQLSTHKTPSREQVVDELRRETLALHEARRRGRGVSDAAVDQAYANMATRMHLTPEQLTAALEKQGVEAATLRRRIRADLAWQQSSRSRMRDGSNRMFDPPLRDKNQDNNYWPRPRWCADCPKFSAADGARSGVVAPGAVAPQQPGAPSPAPLQGGPEMMRSPGLTPPQQKCLEEFAGYRVEVERRASEAAAESKKRPTRARMCEVVSIYADAELKWLEFARTNMNECGLPSQVVEQIKAVHVGTDAAKKKLCALGPSQAGPRWCADCPVGDFDRRPPARYRGLPR